MAPIRSRTDKTRRSASRWQSLDQLVVASAPIRIKPKNVNSTLLRTIMGSRKNCFHYNAFRSKNIIFSVCPQKMLTLCDKTIYLSLDRPRDGV